MAKDIESIQNLDWMIFFRYGQSLQYIVKYERLKMTHSMSLFSLHASLYKYTHIYFSAEKEIQKLIGYLWVVKLEDIFIFQSLFCIL